MPLSTVAPLATSSINIAATPSETVLFGAPLFSKKSLLPGNDAPYAGAEKVAVDHLARAMLKAAILGNERAGTLRIELRKSKALFGLWTKASLVLIGMESERGWPAGSLEAALDAALHGREMAADAWLYAHLREDSASPDGAILDEVRAGLAGRYALDRAQTKTLGFVTGVSWTLTETGERMRGAAQPQEIQALFAACEHERPEIWRALDTAILGAIGRRRESRPDTNTDFNSD